MAKKINGMKAKATRRRRAGEFAEDGLPRDSNAWLEQDWRDLFYGMEAVKKRIAARHAKDLEVEP